MEKYQGTYLSTLPPDLIRELDKYQKFVEDNDVFEHWTDKILTRMNKLANVNPNQAKKDIGEINDEFRKYGITSRYVILSTWPKTTFGFYLNGMQEISRELLQFLKPYAREHYYRYLHQEYVI